MTLLTKDLYYVNKDILDKIETDFDLVDDKSWHKLYQYKSDKTF